MRRKLFPAIVFLILLQPFYPVRAQSADSIRLDKQVVPTFERIELFLDPSQKEYSGSVWIEIEAREQVSSLRFHGAGLNFETITLSHAGDDLDISHKSDEFGVIKIQPQKPLEEGAYTLEVDFTNEFHTDATSLYKFSTDSLSYASTTFWPQFARQAFPCWDEPDFKIPYQVVLTVPPTHLAVSNTPIENEVRQDRYNKVTFARTPPLPSYLIAFAVGPFDTLGISGLSTPGRIVSPKGQARFGRAAAEVTPPILKQLETYFGRAYPYRKLDLIALPEHLFGGMENPGAITFRDNSLLRDPKTTTFEQKRALANIIAHELAHMWFGNLVTIAWWDDLWLSESFASWMATKVTAEVFPEYQVSAVSVQATQSAMVLDAAADVRPVSGPLSARENPMQLLTAITYRKGQAVLEMIERWLGEDVFRDGVLHYLTRYEWRNATSADLWASLSSAADRDVKQAMSTFVEQPGVPLITAAFTVGNRLSLTQERYARYGEEVSDKTTWHIPLILRYADEKDVYSQRILLSEDSQTFALLSDQRPDWLHVNAGEMGYYRWLTPMDQLKLMASRSQEIMNLRERIAFIDNLAALVKAGRLGARELMQMLNHFSDDPEADVMTELIETLTQIKRDLIPTELSSAYAAYVRHTLGPVLDRIGLTPLAHENEQIASLRPALIHALGELGRDDSVLRHSRRLAERYLEDPSSVHPATAEVVLQVAARYAHDGLHEEYLRALAGCDSQDKRRYLLLGLASFTNPTILLEILEQLLSEEVPLEEMSHFLSEMASSATSRETVFDWTTKNYEGFSDKIPAGSAERFILSLADGCSEDLLHRASVFLKQTTSQSKSLETELAKVEKNVMSCVQLRDKQAGSVRAFLSDFENELN